MIFMNSLITTYRGTYNPRLNKDLTAIVDISNEWISMSRN